MKVIENNDSYAFVIFKTLSTNELTITRTNNKFYIDVICIDDYDAEFSTKDEFFEHFIWRWPTCTSLLKEIKKLKIFK